MSTSAVDLALLLFRLTLAVVFLAHGMRHMWPKGRINGTAGWFASIGMRPPLVHAWLASLTEVGCAGLLAFGFLTPLGAAGVVGVMLVAWIANHAKNGFFTFNKGEGYEYVMTLTVCGLVAAILGPGHWSIDAHTGLLRLGGWTGFWIAVGAGGGGAALLLATSWRPSRKPAPTES
jgi:putative oxidoreductase